MILSSWETKNDWNYAVYALDSPPEEFDRFESFVRLWNDKRRDGLLPAWRDFDLEDFEGWWGWVAVMDLEFTAGDGDEDDGNSIDAHYRLWGSNLSDLMGIDLTGKSIRSSEASRGVIEGGFSVHDFKFFEKLISGPSIGRSSGTIFWENQRSYVTLANIRVPLADDGKNVDKFMSAILRGEPLEHEP